MRRIAILDAPSNLGLRPPTVTSVPGCAKAPGALRDHGLITRLHARDAGCLTPPRYDPGDWRPGDGVCHANEIAAYSRKLADRIGGIIDAGEFPVVLGGDCSIVLGSGLAMHRLGEAVGGRIGLVFVDGHSDFRHPGNASYVGAAAGEDLALVTGRGQTDLAAIEGRRPYFRDVDVVVMGIRAQDEYRLDLQAAGIITRPVPTLRVEGAARSAQWARDQLVDCAGYWVHLDMDVLDPAVMPAVDAPQPGGIAFPELELLLAGLVDTPHCLGVEITVFDPDYDPDGAYAEEITSALVAGLAPVRTVAARPDLIAARRDLAARNDGPGADPFTRRRAAAAAGSVTLAAAGMSGPPGMPGDEGEESAAPATTLLGVEAADEVESHSALEGLSDEDDEHDEKDRVGHADVPESAELDDAEPTDSAGPDDAQLDDAGRDDTGQGDAGLDDAGLDDAGLGGAGLGGAGLGGTGLGGTGLHDAGLDDTGPRDAGLGVAELDDTESAENAGLNGVELGDAESDHDEPDDPEPAGQLADNDAEVGDPEEDGPKAVDSKDDHPDVDGSDRDDSDGDDSDGDDSDGDGRERGGRAHGWHPRADGIPAQPVNRPLGSNPLLDSQPLPATRPGMLRPRTTEGFSLPTQRPAFDAGPGEPADIA